MHWGPIIFQLPSLSLSLCISVSLLTSMSYFFTIGLISLKLIFALDLPPVAKISEPAAAAKKNSCTRTFDRMICFSQFFALLI